MKWMPGRCHRRPRCQFQAACCAFTASVLLSAPEMRGATLTLTPVADAALYEETEGATANGAGEFLIAGRNNQATGSRRRSVLRFDLSALPEDVVVTAVSLRLFLFAVTTAENQMHLQRMARLWNAGPSDPAGNETAGVAAVPGEVTWRFASFDDQLWDTPGADAHAPPSASLTVGTTAGYQTWTGAGLVADVNAWLSAPSSNFGWLLRNDETVPQTAKRFASADHPDPSVRPWLAIEYAPIPEPSAAALLATGLALVLGRSRPTRQR